MAYTKVKAIKNHLSRCLDYTANPRKTTLRNDLRDTLAYAQNADKTEHQLFVSGLNCDPDSAFETMQNTRQYWGKADSDHVRVLGYHVIQSFAPGEVIPRRAHEIGCEFARRAFAGRYEVTVSTHLNTGALHNHIVFNSVSFVDGRMFRNDFKGYYKSIRAVSDQLCREYGLSVIDPKQKGKAYIERKAEKEDKPTVRAMIRADVDRSLARAVSWETFVYGLRQMGYTVKYGPNIKYATLRHKSGSRNIRLKSLGEGYDEASIRNLLEYRAWGEETKLPHAAEDSARAIPTPKRPISSQRTVPIRPIRRARLRSAFPILPRRKYTGFMALYYRYVCLLGKTRQRRTSRRCYFLLREDFQQFDRYVEQFKFVWEHNIQSQEDLDAAREAAESERDALTNQRRHLYQRRSTAKRAGKEQDAADLSAQIAALSIEIRTRRRELMLCGWINEDAQRLRAQLAEAEHAERQEQNRQQTKTNRRRGYER